MVQGYCSKYRYRFKLAMRTSLLRSQYVADLDNTDPKPHCIVLFNRLGKLRVYQGVFKGLP